MRLCETAPSEDVACTYRGHIGPCYRVAMSPFCDACFLTAGADGCVRLWTLDSVRSIIYQGVLEKLAVLQILGKEELEADGAKILKKRNTNIKRA